jgi:hypothetical protein
MHEAAINKILHALTMRLREAASNPTEARELDVFVSALTELFGLDSEDNMSGQGESVPPRATKVDRRDSISPQTPADDRTATEPTGAGR